VARISTVINTLNEEENLPRALASVKDFADEIVVVDMHSDDQTVDIAKKSGARVFEHDRTGYVEPARNFAISKAEGDWILILDADEELSQSLSKSLRKIADNPAADYYRLPRKNIIFGRWIKHTGWWPDYNIRFFKKGCVSWNEIIHSVPTTQGAGSDLKADEENALVHHNYRTAEQYVERMNRYTSYQAKELAGSGRKFVWQFTVWCYLYFRLFRSWFYILSCGKKKSFRNKRWSWSR
jgi:glycosyltransferase involved in cell wall biosynthesis